MSETLSYHRGTFDCYVYIFMTYVSVWFSFVVLSGSAKIRGVSNKFLIILMFEAV